MSAMIGGLSREMVAAAIRPKGGGEIRARLGLSAIVPVAGSNLLTDPGFEAWDDATTPTSWTPTIAGTSTVNREDATFRSDAHALRFDIDASNSNAQVTQAVAANAGQWCETGLYGRASKDNYRVVMTWGLSPVATYSFPVLLTTEWGWRSFVGRKTATGNSTLCLQRHTGASSLSVYVDDTSVKVLTFSSLLRRLGDIGRRTGTWTCAPTVAAGKQAGLALNVADESNLVLAYVNSVDGKAYLEKCIAGTWTTVISGAIVYAAGAELQVFVTGTDYQLFYAGVQVGLTTAIADASLGTQVYGFATSTDSAPGVVQTRPFELPDVLSAAQAATTYEPSAYFDGLFYGHNGGQMFSSADGADWTLVGPCPGRGLWETGDGELLTVAGGLVQKSSGWSTDPATMTWSVVLTPTATCWPLPWGVDTYGGVAIVSEYGPYGASRYVYVSTDNGDTFTPSLDLEALEADTSNCHWHSVCIDPYAGGRLWAAHGDGPRGIYYSDDNGTTWAKASAARQPTVMVATVQGIVCGTDLSPHGLARIRRTANPADMTVENMYSVRAGEPMEFAYIGARDAVTGLAYIGFRAATDDVARLYVSDGMYAQIIYETADPGNPYYMLMTAHGGRVLATVVETDNLLPREQLTLTVG